MKSFMLGSIVCLLLVLGLSLAQGAGRGSAKDIYELYRISPEAPLSVTFKGRCIEAEDSAAHLKLVEYNGSNVVYGCYKRGY